MRQIVFILMIFCLSTSAKAQNVTIHAVNQPAATVFRSIVEQTGKNFIYSSEILKDVTVTVSVRNKPLKKALSEMFKNTGIQYSFKGNNIILKRKRGGIKALSNKMTTRSQIDDAKLKTMALDEVVVQSRLEDPAVETAEIGAMKLTSDRIRNTPSLFGENDVIKALHLHPGVTEGIESLAGMYVHGGNADENLYMLDNIPIYQANHFAGLFSAFNTEAIRYIDFFKSSIPAKYDGRLSSFIDVRTKNGSTDGHHGSAKLGLTSGGFNISGPIKSKTTYLFGLRRSWYDLLTIPVIALVNSKNDDEKIRFRYHFMDLNAKMKHRFSNRTSGFVSVYFGDDMLKSGTKDKYTVANGWYEDEKFDLHWGNLIVQTGVNYRIDPQTTSEFTAAYTRFFSDLNHDDANQYYTDSGMTETRSINKTDNKINDWILRGDFDRQVNEFSRIRFGANYVRHSFLPSRATRNYTYDSINTFTRDSTQSYGADEVNAYIENDRQAGDHIRMNIGIHGSLFHIDGKTNYGIAPRLSVNYRPIDNVAVKAAYSRTTQYVHLLTQSYLALPTDQWIPIIGNQKPQTADKASIGGYWQSRDGKFSASVEGYYKYMRNLIDYRDEHYLHPPLETWNARLTTGHGTSKGIDLKIEKTVGKFTGHIAYSLAWADRTFKEKNDGKKFPARFDNRHTIKAMLNWTVNDRVQLNASWTGHSGNRFTLLPQVWEGGGFGGQFSYDDVPLKCPVNNYQLPFYHRLDLSCNVKNSHGFWTFSVYNAYCHMNTIGIKRGYKDIHEITPEGITYVSRPVFQKVRLLPIIPSISYTWLF